MGDLFYGTVFALPYWDYLNPTGLDPEDLEFIREGCLVMILAMAWERIDGAGSYMSQFHERIQESLDSLEIEDEPLRRLLHTVKLAVSEAAQEKPVPSESLMAESNWVHREFVRGYFASMTKSFDSDYFKEKDALNNRRV